MSNRPIAPTDTPDPWLIPSPHHPPSSPLYYLTFTLGNRIEIWSSPYLESFDPKGPTTRTSLVWQPPPGSPWSADIWAPELHWLFGNWWIYAAAAPPQEGNKGHRTVVLRCVDARQDPMCGVGGWRFEGVLPGLPDGQWAIDATVFSPDPGLGPNADGQSLGQHQQGYGQHQRYGQHGQYGQPPQQQQQGLPDEQRRWYICYSGWPIGDHSDTQQDLFIARLMNPLQADESTVTCISRAELDWERPEGGRRGVNEGPTWVAFPDQQQGGFQGQIQQTPWRGIVYSAHGSWTSEYKLGLLQFIGDSRDDLCNPNLWLKRPQPLLVSDPKMGGPFGPGHASFIPSPMGNGTVLCIYHGTEKEGEGWANRKGRVLELQRGCFESERTMCCAYSLCGGVDQNHGVMPGHVGQQMGAQLHGGGGMGGYPGQQPVGQNYSGGAFPGQQQQQPHQQQHYGGGGAHGQVPQQGQSSSGGFGKQFEKYAGQAEKYVPAQYQGYLNKAKKFFK